MQENLNSRTIGACIIGFAMVGGAYVVSNFGQSPEVRTQQATIATLETTPRVAIAVTDQDQNGLEDWRDEFVETEAIELDPIELEEEYQEPTTLTDQLGVNFIESFLMSKTYGSFGRTQEELVNDTVDVLATETAHDLFDTPDISILQSNEPQAVRTYANTIALAIINNNVKEAESELLILSDIMESGAEERVDELTALADAYKNIRDDTMATPVPAFLVKEHLDLINTYHAIHKDIEAMAITIDDPAFGLMRLKRYEDDAAGLGFALANMYDALLPYAALLQQEDPALLFVAFSPEFKS